MTGVKPDRSYLGGVRQPPLSQTAMGVKSGGNCAAHRPGGLHALRHEENDRGGPHRLRAHGAGGDALLRTQDAQNVRPLRREDGRPSWRTCGSGTPTSSGGLQKKRPRSQKGWRFSLERLAGTVWVRVPDGPPSFSNVLAWRLEHSDHLGTSQPRGVQANEITSRPAMAETATPLPQTREGRTLRA